MTIVRYTTEQLKQMIARGEDRTDWERVRNMKDEDIVYDKDSPDLGPLFEAGRLRRVPNPVMGRPRKENPKQVVSIRVDADIYVALPKMKNWSTRVNDMMRGMLAASGAL